jgi:hypothetical protein
MSDPAFPEHWFDRLAVRQTRRQVLRAALAGAALTLPFARTAPAQADPDCSVGCSYSAGLAYDRESNACNKGGVGIVTTFVVAALIYLGKPLTAAELNARSPYTACMDRALMGLKAKEFDCSSPGCPGFDPKGPDGPCAHLPPGAHCCPDISVANGYSMCAQCCSPTGKGCGSGQTDCQKG